MLRLVITGDTVALVCLGEVVQHTARFVRRHVRGYRSLEHKKKHLPPMSVTNALQVWICWDCIVETHSSSASGGCAQETQDRARERYGEAHRRTRQRLARPKTKATLCRRHTGASVVTPSHVRSDQRRCSEAQPQSLWPLCLSIYTL